MCIVVNLSTQEKQIYTCSPKEAVIAAYAQSLNNWNTWDYDIMYSHLVLEGIHTLSCGDFSVFKDEKNFDKRQ